MPLEPYRKPLTEKQRRKQRQRDDADAWTELIALAKQALTRSGREPDWWLEIYDWGRPSTLPQKIIKTEPGWRFYTDRAAQDSFSNDVHYYFSQSGEIFTGTGYDASRQAARVHSHRNWASVTNKDALVRALQNY